MDHVPLALSVQFCYLSDSVCVRIIGTHSTSMYRKRHYSLIGEKVILVPYSPHHVERSGHVCVNGSM